MNALYKYITILFVGISFSPKVSAQLNPLGNMYYQNQYLGNPAFAGVESELNINGIYRKQFSGMPGSPITQSFTGDYGFDNRAAVGLNLNFSKSGLINNMRVMATYAYHLPINDDNKLHFGLSLGVMREYINNRDITGDNFDPITNRFNDRGNQLDGDFGLAFTGKKLTLQAAIINLHNYLETNPNLVNGVNFANFYSALAYKIDVSNQLIIEPKVAYRGIKGFEDVIDAGLNLTYEERFSIYSLYHSTKSATFGFGVGYNDALTFTGMYTTNTSDLKGYSNGDFEIGLNLKINRKKN